MKLKTTLRKLHDLDVTFVSLVDRGANRIPFRIVKSQEPGMLNLSTLFSFAKADKPATPADTEVKPAVPADTPVAGDGAKPEVPNEVTVVAPESAPADAAPVVEGEAADAEVKAKKSEDESTDTLAVILAESDADTLSSLSTLGFNHTTTYEDGTVLVSKSEDLDPTAHALVKMDEGTLLVVKGFSPYGQKCDALPFAAAIQAKGFYESFRMAGYMAADRVQDGMYRAASPKDAAEVVRKHMTECMDYMIALAEGLPASLFNENGSDMAVSVYKACSKKPVTKAGEDEEDQSAVSVSKAGFPPAKPKKPGEPEAPAAAPAASAAPAAKPEVKPEPEAGKPEDAQAKPTAPVGGSDAGAGDEAGADKPKGKVPPQFAGKEGGKGGDAEGEAEGTAEGPDGEMVEGEAAPAAAAPAKTQQEFMEEVLASVRGFAEIVQTVQALNGGMTNILKRVDDLSTEVAGFKTTTEQKIDVAVKKAETATQVVQGTVVASDLGGDPTPVEVKKADSDPRSGVFDTAFIRR